MARLFDGSEYLINANAVAGNGGGASSYELALVCWANSDNGVLDNQVPFYIGDSTSDNRFAINFNTGGGTPDNVRAWSDGGVLRLATTGIAWTVDAWHHVCAIFPSNTDRRIFLDGANKATNADDDAGVVSVDQTMIGAEQRFAGPEGFFSGHIGECAVYDLSVWPGATASDRADAFEKIIPSLANADSPEFYPLGLVAYWRLIRGLNDKVGGYNMAATGTVVTAHPRIIYPSKIWVPSGVAAAPPTKGQVITIIMSKLIIPSFYIKQGKTKRRDFMKNTFLASIGIR